MKKDYFFSLLIILGIYVSLVMIFGIWEFNVLQGQVRAFQKFPKTNFVFETGALPYIVAIISWTILILLNGAVWSKILFPHRSWVEKFIFSLVSGVIIMPVSFMIPFLIGVATRVFSSLIGKEPPGYVDIIFDNHKHFLVSNHEQTYEFVNLLAFIIIGLIVLAIVSALRTGKNNQSIAAQGSNP